MHSKNSSQQSAVVVSSTAMSSVLHAGLTAQVTGPETTTIPRKPIFQKIRVLNSPNFTSLKRAKEHIARGRAEWADPEHKSILFKEVGRQISAAKHSAVTTNDANWKAAITPNPWRILKSAGFDVMQIDTRVEEN